MKLSVESEWADGNKGLGVRLRSLRTGGFWRIAAYWGTPPGSHIGFWRTRYDGVLRGLNYRIGRRYVGPTLTMFMHWRRGSYVD